MGMETPSQDEEQSFDSEDEDTPKKANTFNKAFYDMCDFGLPPEVNGYTAGRAMEPRAKEASEDECGGCGNLKQSCHEVRFGVFLCQDAKKHKTMPAKPSLCKIRHQCEIWKSHAMLATQFLA